MANEPRTIFLNIAPVPGAPERFYVAACAETRFMVDKVATPERVACVEVKWREGEGL